MPDADRKPIPVPKSAAGSVAKPAAAKPAAAKAADVAGREPTHPDALNSVLAALREHGSLPSIGSTLARLTQMLENDTDAVHDLANVILADVSLTQRLLHLANTLPYRAGTPPVTTVTRAIMLLGFNQIRTAAVSLVLLEGVLGAGRSDEVRSDFHHALLAGNLAREMLMGAFGDEAEEASIAAMFRSVGRLLVASFAPAAYAAVRTATHEERVPEPSASRRVLGRSYDEIAHQVLQQWSVPDRIAAAALPPPPRITAPTGAAERVRCAAQLADEVAGVLRAAGASPCENRIDEVLARYAPAFSLERAQLATLLERASTRTNELEAASGLPPIATPEIRLLEALPAECQLEPEAVQASVERDAVGRPANARSVLLAGLSEATESLARSLDRGVDLNAIIRIVLEAMYTGLGYARAAFFLRDPAAGLYRVRASFGDPPLKFTFPSQYAPDLFHAALAQSTDLHIADTEADKVRAKLPAWFARELPQAKSFLLLPLTVNQKAVGLFLACRHQPDPAGLSSEELNLVRSLRNQVVLAIRTK